MKGIQISILLVIISMNLSFAQTTNDDLEADNEKALVSYDDFEELVKVVKEIRSERLINYDQLLQYQSDPNTIILDARSRDKYEGKHIKGAINLPFTEFTQANLRRIIPDINTRIIIYCNNNFKGDRIYFASKVFTPEMRGRMSILKGKREIMLALNIPTYLNLYGYGYRNIYELNELVEINDSRVVFEGNNGVRLRYANSHPSKKR